MIVARPHDGMFSREEHVAQQNRLRGNYRPPRRAQSTLDYVYPTSPSMPSLTSLVSMTPSRTFPIRPKKEDIDHYYQQQQRQQQQKYAAIEEEMAAAAAAGGGGAETAAVATPTPEEAADAAEAAARAAIAAAQAEHRAKVEALARVAPTRPPQRPKLPSPRRSYSVMDYEPVPPQQQPSENLTLSDLPPELHFAIFDHLDRIDSTCLGLTNSHFYAIHRRLHGQVSLCERRAGPNDMEWSWSKAGRPVDRNSKPLPTPMVSRHELSKLRVKGQALCRKCGTMRCELHVHIRDWMGPDYDYCEVRSKFVPRPAKGAAEQCSQVNPRNPRVCGRHRLHKTRTPSPANSEDSGPTRTNMGANEAKI